MRGVSVLVAVALVASLVGAASVAIATDVPDDNPEPGERLAGVIGVQHAEHGGDIAQRGFGIAIANATTDEAVAVVVAMRLAEVNDRINTIERQLDELEERRAADNVSPGQYQAAAATLEAERTTTERLVNQSAVAAHDVPAALRTEYGIEPEHVNELRERTHELTGPEVATIAREIAGPDAGAAPVEQPDDRVSPDSPTEHRGISNVSDREPATNVTEASRA